MGFIAEEMEKIDPRLVVYDKDGTIMSVRYTEYTALLTKAIQELDQKITTIASSTGSGSTLTTNGWSVDQVSGKVNVGFYGNVNVNDNAILDVSKISGYLGKWQITEEGRIVAEEIETKKLKVGSPEAPQGITIYDRATHQPVCVFSENNSLRSEPGECGDNSSSLAPTSSPTPTPAPAPEPPASLTASSSSETAPETESRTGDGSHGSSMVVSHSGF